MKISILFVGILASQLLFSQTTSNVLFYNVENLFDTIDSPNVDDVEYLPNSSKKWNSEKYNDKINHITEVMNQFSSIALMGMCEIENKNVVQDVVNAQKKTVKSCPFR